MRKLALLTGALLVLGGTFYLPATADDDKTVNAMVTPKVIAITVSTNSLQYGTVGVGTTNAVPTPAKITVTNSGTVLADFRVRGGVSTPGGWTLTNGAPGADTYRHKYDTSSSGPFLGYLATTSEDFANDIVAGGTKDIFFKLDMPTSTASLDEQTLPIVITALEAQ